MTGIRSWGSGVVVSIALVFLAVVLCQGPAYAAGKEGADTAGILSGKVTMSGSGSPVAGAVVKLRNLNNQKEYFGKPSDVKGNYLVAGVEEGWYTVGVTTPAGDFNLSYGIYIKAGDRARLSMALKEGGAIDGKGLTSKKGFFKTPGGVALIVAAVGGAGFAVYELTKNDEEEVSAVR